MTYILSIICIVFGAALVYKPDLFWNLEHCFTVKGGEPTKFYLIAKRVVGIICICGGVAAIILVSII